jgi:hypothetical protein
MFYAFLFTTGKSPCLPHLQDYSLDFVEIVTVLLCEFHLVSWRSPVSSALNKMYEEDYSCLASQ